MTVPQESFCSLHSPWAFLVHCIHQEAFWFTAFPIIVPCARNSHWERHEPKRLDLTMYILFFYTLSPMGGLWGTVGWDKKAAYVIDILVSILVPMCYIMWHFWPWCTLGMGIPTRLQHRYTNIGIAKSFTKTF
jgi:hypothetical protein